MPVMKPPRPYMTTGQVAKLLGVSPRSVAKMTDAGKLQHYRIPVGEHGDRRICRAGVAEYFRTRGLPIPPGVDVPNVTAVHGLPAGWNIEGTTNVDTLTLGSMLAEHAAGRLYLSALVIGTFDGVGTATWLGERVSTAVPGVKIVYVVSDDFAGTKLGRFPVVHECDGPEVVTLLLKGKE